MLAFAPSSLLFRKSAAARRARSRLRMRVPKSLLLLIVVVPFFVSAAGPQFELTIDNIMRGPGLVGYEPREVRWSGDGQKLYFSWKQPTDPILAETDTYVINRDGTGLRKLTEAEERMAPPSGGSFSP